MNYTDWGNNAHWYIELELIPNSIYNWSVEISNLCASNRSLVHLQPVTLILLMEIH